MRVCICLFSMVILWLKMPILGHVFISFGYYLIWTKSRNRGKPRVKRWRLYSSCWTTGQDIFLQQPACMALSVQNLLLKACLPGYLTMWLASFCESCDCKSHKKPEDQNIGLLEVNQRVGRFGFIGCIGQEQRFLFVRYRPTRPQKWQRGKMAR